MSLLILPFITHAMVPSEFGAASMLSAASLLIATVIAAPLIQLIVRAAARDGDDGPSLLRAAGTYCYYVLPVFVAITAAIFWLGVPQLLGVSGGIWAIELLAIGFQPAASTFALWVAQARQDLRRFVWLSSTSVIVTAVSKLVLVVGLDMGVLGWVISDLFSAVITAALAIALVGLPRARVDREHIRYILKFSLPLVPHSASLWALTSLSRPAMAAVSPLEQVGLLSFGLNLAQVAGLVLAESNRAALPHYSREVLPAPTQESFGAVRWQMIGALVVPAVVGSGVAVGGPLIFADAYWPSFFLTGVLLVGQAAYGLYLIPMNYLTQTAALPRYSALASGSGAILILVSILVFGRSTGAVGVAFATSAGYLVMAVVAMLLIKSHKLDIAWRSWRGAWREALLGAGSLGWSIAALSAPVGSAMSWSFAGLCLLFAVGAIVLTRGQQARPVGDGAADTRAARSKTARPSARMLFAKRLFDVDWVSIAVVPLALLTGVVATISPSLTIAVVAFCVGVAVVVARFRRTSILRLVVPTTGFGTDWVIAALPTAIAIRTINSKWSLLAIGMLVALALLRRPDAKYSIKPGPLLMLLAASAIVYVRPANAYYLLTFLFLVVLVLRLVTTVDARRIIPSLIDGCGLYLLANVAGYFAGLQSPASDARISGLVEDTGFIRIIYPLTWSINIPPILAAVYVTSFAFLIVQPGLRSRLLRTIYFLAAVTVLIGAGTRMPLAIAALLVAGVFGFPAITRWLGQATALFASISAFVLPALISSLAFAIVPLMSLAPGRGTTIESITSLQGRDSIWEHSITFWMVWVRDLPQVLFGFGANGQYLSGASMSYKDELEALVRNPELAFVHNSFLQQIFDGGVVGWALLTAAAVWASMRFADRRRTWGIWAVSAITAMAALLLTSVTEVSLSPGPAMDPFWVFLILVGVSCQVSSKTNGDSAVESYSTDSITPGLRRPRDNASEELASTSGEASQT